MRCQTAGGGLFVCARCGMPRGYDEVIVWLGGDDPLDSSCAGAHLCAGCGYGLLRWLGREWAHSWHDSLGGPYQPGGAGGDPSGTGP